MTTVIHHSADKDGEFCREIARKFLPEARFIGWDFKDAPLLLMAEWDQIYVLDLPLDKPFGLPLESLTIPSPALAKSLRRTVWIDHHKSAIESHPKDIPGYRIDGVGACRLAYAWFEKSREFGDTPLLARLPTKENFLTERVSEPIAVRLAGQYDVWQHEPSGGADIAFQFGLDVQETLDWEKLLTVGHFYKPYVDKIVDDGRAAMACYAKRDADVMRERGFLLKWENLTFLALNTARCNSNTFAALDKPETGHDALLAFYWNGRAWTISLYHAAHRKDLDLSIIAVKYGGGGHRGACGMTCRSLPFPTG